EVRRVGSDPQVQRKIGIVAVDVGSGQVGVVDESPPGAELVTVESVTECGDGFLGDGEQRRAGEPVLRKRADVAEFVRVTPNGGLQAELADLFQCLRRQEVVDHLNLLAGQDAVLDRLVVDGSVHVSRKPLFLNTDVWRGGKELIAPPPDGNPRRLAVSPIQGGRKGPTKNP